jgi:hypothetical protein
MPWGSPVYAVPDQVATIYLGDQGTSTSTLSSGLYVNINNGPELDMLLNCPLLTGLLKISSEQKIIGIGTEAPFSVGPTFRKNNRKIP